MRRSFVFDGFSNSNAQRDHGVHESKRRCMLVARDHPNAGVDGESVQNVSVRSILAFSPDGHRLLPSEKF